jgi:hypothetical protein
MLRQPGRVCQCQGGRNRRIATFAGALLPLSGDFGNDCQEYQNHAVASKTTHLFSVVFRIYVCPSRHGHTRRFAKPIGLGADPHGAAVEDDVDLQDAKAQNPGTSTDTAERPSRTIGHPDTPVHVENSLRRIGTLEGQVTS